MTAYPAGDPGPYEVIHLGGEAVVIVPLGDLRQLQAVQRELNLPFESAELLKRWTDLKNTAVPELNRALRQSQAPEVHIEDHPPQIESTVDEE